MLPNPHPTPPITISNIQHRILEKQTGPSAHRTSEISSQPPTNPNEQQPSMTVQQQEMDVVLEAAGPFNNEDLLEFLAPLLDDEDFLPADADNAGGDASNAQQQTPPPPPPPRLTLAEIQAAGGDPVAMLKGEEPKAPPMPQHDILLGSHHYSHRTIGNNVCDSEVRPHYPREDSFDVQAFLEQVHEANQAYMPGTPFPKAWIGADKVRSEADYDPDNAQLHTFAVGNVGKQDKRYTVVQASADCIRRDHNEGKGRWNKRRKTSHDNNRNNSGSSGGGSNGSGGSAGTGSSGGRGGGGAGSAGGASNSSSGGSTVPTTGTGSSGSGSFGGSSQQGSNNSNQARAASAAELSDSPPLQPTYFEECRQHSTLAGPQGRLLEGSSQRPIGLDNSAVTTMATAAGEDFNPRTATDDDDDDDDDTPRRQRQAKPQPPAIVATRPAITGGRCVEQPSVNVEEGQVPGALMGSTDAAERPRTVVVPSLVMEVDNKKPASSDAAPAEPLKKNDLRHPPPQEREAMTATILDDGVSHLPSDPFCFIEAVPEYSPSHVFAHQNYDRHGPMLGEDVQRSIGQPDEPTASHKVHPCTSVQPRSNVRMIQQGEHFAPLPQYDVLLAAPHSSFLTEANRAHSKLNMNKLNASRSVFGVKTDVKKPLHRALQQTFGEDVPAPKFWIGADKVRSKGDWKPGSMRTFAVGENLDKCYTVYEATDRRIAEESSQYSKGMKWSDEEEKGCAPSAMDQAVNMMDGDAPQTDGSASIGTGALSFQRLGLGKRQQSDGYAGPSPATEISKPGDPHQAVLFGQGLFSNGNTSNDACVKSLHAVRSPRKPHHERRSHSNSVGRRSLSLEEGFKSLQLSDRASPVGTIEELEGTIDNVLFKGKAERVGLSPVAVDPPQECHVPNNHVANLDKAYQGPLEQLQVLLPDSELQKDVEPPDIFLVRDFGSERQPTQAYALLRGKEPINLSHGSRHSDWGCLFFGVICQRVGPRSFQATPQQVAIKRLNKRVVHEYLEKGGQENPYKEAARMQELGDNENVLRLVEFLEDDNYLYIVTPRAIGTLADFIEWGDPSEVMEPRRVRQIFFKILKILQYLESRGISHRDLSPSNFLFLTEDNLVVFDLAMSIRIPKDDATGQRCLIKPQGRAGTASFMAPEVHENQAFDGAAIDLWSAATILYSLLTNQRLYKRPCETDRAFSFFVGAQGLSSDPWNEKSQSMLEAMQNAGNFGTIRKLCDQAEAHNYIGEGAITLLENLLVVEPAQRYTLSQAMQSDFFQDMLKEA